MIYRLDNIKIDIGGGERELREIARNKLRGEPSYFRIVRKSLDARDKGNIHWVYSVEFSSDEQPKEPPLEKCDGRAKILIIGSGPAGLFCALRLIDRGFRPIVIERGECVERRAETVNRFFASGELNEESNVQFGEGGAGTFSDGKLNTGTKSAYNREVLRKFALFGAPEEVEYLNKPHIGSDKLKAVVAAMRKYITANGGQVRFSTRFERVIGRDKVRAAVLTDLLTGEEYEESADAVVLAIGHSARDTFEALEAQGAAMEGREFAVGVRIEHLRENVDASQYGKMHALLPAADYKAVSHAGDRTAFTFCMCPGGYVVAAASERGGVVTNGMSDYARNARNSNSGLLVNIRKSDLASDDVLAGVRFQREIERKAYLLGGGEYKAPVQLVGDFLADRPSKRFGSVLPTYSRGTVFAELKGLFPQAVTHSLALAITDIGRRNRGFDHPDAVLTGAETRFTSPVRILRGPTGESLTAENLYPCGEGAGYSGGITSSAADGMRIADFIFRKFGGR